jgi:hypothetical protein
VEFPLTILATALIGPAQFSTYVCLDDTVFTISTSDEMAIVRFKDGEYRLPRRRSSIAVKYATEVATLYLDGEFAAFVADDRPLPGCHKVKADERDPPEALPVRQ